MNRIDKLKQFFAQDPQDAFTLYSLAHEYQQMQDWEQAILYFEQLRAAHPTYTGLYYHLGRCYEKVNQAAKGLEIFYLGKDICTQTGDTHALAELSNTIINREMGIDDD